MNKALEAIVAVVLELRLQAFNSLFPFDAPAADQAIAAADTYTNSRKTCQRFTVRAVRFTLR